MVVERVKKSRLVDDVVVASPQPIPLNISKIFIGDENDVLKRYYDCAKEYKATTIVRITADCPFVLPETIDDCIWWKNLMGADYVAAVEPNYPDGMDVEVFTNDLLVEANKMAKTKEEREHVTPYMREHAEVAQYIDFWRWHYEGRREKTSVDTEKDLRRCRRLWTGKVKPYWSSEERGVLGVTSSPYCWINTPKQ